METRITVADGQTLVSAVFLQTDYNQSTTRTPLMSSLPLVGRLFRHRIVRDDQQELLVFVTAFAGHSAGACRRDVDRKTNGQCLIRPRD